MPTMTAVNKEANVPAIRAKITLPITSFFFMLNILHQWE